MQPAPDTRDPRATPHAQRRSLPVESLLAAPPGGVLACDVLIVGSGYGGSFAAAELACEGRSVWVLERGREYARGEFPETLGELPGHVQFMRGDDTGPRGRRDALFDLKIDEDAVALVGCGLGGGSLINAGVVLEPRRDIFDDPRWPRAVREDREALDAAFAHVRRVLGAAPFASPECFPKYRALQRLAHAIPGVRVEPAPIAVSQCDGPNAVGVEQKACVACGNCVTGCNHDAKNTLAMNAIPLAIQRGARFWTGAKAVGVARQAGGPTVPGSGAATRWRVSVERVASLGQDRALADTFEIHARVVVVAAGTLGSTELLLRSTERGLATSDRLGRRFSGNGDLLSFGFAQAHEVDAVARVASPRRDTQARTPAPDPRRPPDCSPDRAGEWARIGPTIVGMVSSIDPGAGRSADGRLPPRAVLQEGAMPGSLRPLLGTLLSTVGMVHAYAADDLPAYAKAFQVLDPLGAPESLLRHCQVLLAMGADASDGCLALDSVDLERRPASERRLRMSLAYATNDPTIAAVDAALAGACRPARPWHDGFDGGYHVPNPVWKAAPEGGDQIVGELGSRLVTVHPIGGCVMAEDRRGGVVDTLGTVFDASSPDPTAVLPGLHVLDGAILPTALGVNPMLTIAALSVRAAGRIRVRLDGEDAARRAAGHRPPADDARPRRIRCVDEALSRPPHERTRVPSPDVDVTLGFAEVLHTESGCKVDPGALAPLFDERIGPLAHPSAATPGATRPASAALACGDAGLVLKVDASTPLAGWIAEPWTAWTGTAELSVYRFPFGPSPSHATGFDGGPVVDRPGGGGARAATRADAPAPADGADAPPRRDATASLALRHVVARGTCRLHLLRADPPETYEAVRARRTAALAGFYTRRPQDGARTRAFDHLTGRPSVRPEHCASPREGGVLLEAVEARRAPEDHGVGPALSNAGDYERALQFHLVWRELAYEATLTVDGTRTIRLTGTKRLAYSDREANPWDALLWIDIHAECEGRRAGPWRMRVDVLELLKNGVFRIDDAPDTPTAIAGIASAAGLWFRALAQSHYWSFPGAAYGVRVHVPRGRWPLSSFRMPDGRTVRPVGSRTFEVPASSGDDCEPLCLRVTRYRADSAPTRGALLLVHGLAHGGEVFVSPTVPMPLAGRFVAEGWDVFVLDHRLSNRLGGTARRRTSIDDIAKYDIPRAFDTVEAMLGKEEQIRVFAHCIGAAAVSMAVLSGALTRGGRSRISALVLHAVHPWVVPSRWNRVSAALAAVYQDFVGDEVVDPIPPTSSEAFDQVVDRIGASIPWPAADWAMHHAELHRGPCVLGHAICNRMTLFYGREWRHANLTPETHESLHELVGPAHVDVFKQVFFLALRQRLTDRNGDNTYLRSERIAAHWTFPTLFATGTENKVFDAASAARSYLLMSLLRGHAALNGTPLPGRVGLYLPEGVGHMDFLLGRYNHLPHDARQGKPDGAGHGLHDTLAKFLSDPNGWIRAQQAEGAGPGSAWHRALAMSPQVAAESTPWVGPMIQYERKADGSAIELRVWYEVRAYQTRGPSISKESEGAKVDDWTLEPLSETFEGERLPLPGVYRVARRPLIVGSGNAAAQIAGEAPEVKPPPPLKYDGFGPMRALDMLSSTPDGDTRTASARADGLLQATSRSSDAVLANGRGTKNRTPAEPVPPHVARLINELSGTILGIPTDDIGTAPWIGHLVTLIGAGTGDRTMTFLLASCRWPGLAFERAAIERPIRAMRERVEAATRRAGSPIDALFLLGDQVYADAMADAFDVHAPAERAARRYREAFSGDVRFDEHYPSDAMRALLARVPCWSVVDDHEFDDDWPGASPGQPLGDTFRRRFAAAVAYQWRRVEARDGGRPALGERRVLRGLWQPFEAATLPCFALDTRTERTLRTHRNVDRATIIGAAQREALEDWLARGAEGPDPDAPKLILSGSPIGLPRADEARVPGAALRADDWHGYPASCRALMQAVLDADLDDVVMLCGDPHYSCVVCIEATGRVGDETRRCRLHVVVASGLNASLPFANGHPRELLRDTVTLPWSDDGLVAKATATPLSSAPRQFCELAVRLGADGSRSIEVVSVDEHGSRTCVHRVPLAATRTRRAACRRTKEVGR